MKKLNVLFVALVSLTLLALAAPVAAADSMTAEVVDLGCYEKGQKGEGHAKCAARCVAGGAEMALIVDGEVYIVDDAASDAGAIKTLRANGGKNVEVTADTAEKDGKMIAHVKTAKAAG